MMPPYHARHRVGLLLLLLPGLVWSAEPYPAVLPAEPVVRSVLEKLPQVNAARHGISLEQANGSRLRSGNYEWNARTTLQQRRESTGPRYTESEVVVERPVRWFGKAEKDAALGAQGEVVAVFSLADTWHEASRGLLKAWFDWLRESRAAQRLAEQVTILDRQLEYTGKRVKAGDAPKVEIMLTEAERDRVAGLQLQATQRAKAAALNLQYRYPGLALQAPRQLPLPRLGPESEEVWKTKILSDNHELELTDAEMQYAKLRSERLSQERTPDPTIGVRLAQERDRQDTLIGVIVSIPFGGGWRNAQHQAGMAQAAIAAERNHEVRIKVGADAARVVNASRLAQGIWERLANVARQTGTNADLVMKAYGLGESNLIEALQVRRQAIEAALAAEAAQIDALEAHARLLLDAHEIWAFDHDDRAHHQAVAKPQ
jgi:cobalt-zinc-cadmium efflux system outer membrane protein